MKLLITIQLFACAAFSSFSQFQKPQWEMPIYFEDADGVKDTVWVGYDEKASAFRDVIDTIFDEIPKKVDTSKFVVYLNRFWVKKDSLTRRSITSIVSSSPELGTEIIFNKGKFPLTMYWDSDKFNDDSLPFPNTAPQHKAKLWIENIFGSAYLLSDSGKSCCFHCRYTNVSDQNYVFDNWECPLNDSIKFNSVDNDFYSIQKGLGRLSLKLVPLNKKLNVGISEDEREEFSVYPNPFSDKITIRNNYNEGAKIEVFNMQLEIIIQTLINPQSELSISLENLARGMYFIKFENSKTNQVIKVIKSE